MSEDQRDPRESPLAPDLVGCCQVYQTMEIGPGTKTPPGAAVLGQLWNTRTPLEMHHRAPCSGGLLALNELSFATSNGDYTAPLRGLELFLIRTGVNPDDRVDPVTIPIFKGTVALYFRHFAGGFPIPLNTSGRSRMELRVRVAPGPAEPWAVTVGLMLTLQNEF